MAKTSGSESYLIPLEGTLQCEIGGCYEDIEKYKEWLIPETNFSCPPPGMPSNSEYHNIHVYTIITV